MVPRKVCLVTGASSGLGRATAALMAQAGFDVALVARSAEDLAEAAREAETAAGRLLTLPADLADPDACQAVVDRTAHDLGRLDVVVNAAATDVPKDVADLEVDEWDRVLDVNLRAPFLLAKHAVAHLRAVGGGTIVNVSSVAGRRGWRGASAYCASKFGLTGLTQALNAEGRAHGIRACVVHPGAMDTHWGAWQPQARRQGDTGGRTDPGQALDAHQVGRLILWIASAPPEVVVNESTITPLHEQGWP